jgi:hypothetical protein
MRPLAVSVRVSRPASVAPSGSVSRSGSRSFAVAVAVALPLAFAFAFALAACGETRRPIGDECLRDDDCLSGVCADRVCVSAPSLVTGAESPPPDDSPRIPAGDAAVVDAAPKDAGDG